MMSHEARRGTYVFWFIYMTKAFWGPEKKVLKTGLKCNFFGNNTVMISVSTIKM